MSISNPFDFQQGGTSLFKGEIVELLRESKQISESREIVFFPPNSFPLFLCAMTEDPFLVESHEFARLGWAP